MNKARLVTAVAAKIHRAKPQTRHLRADLDEVFALLQLKPVSSRNF